MPGGLERAWVVEDVSRTALVTQGLLIAVGGSAVGWFALAGGWRPVAIGLASTLGGALGLFGRMSSFWIEGGSVCWGVGTSITRVPIDRGTEIRTVFVPRGPRAVHLELAQAVIEIPIEMETVGLRREIGRMFREREPNAALSDARAMDALFLR